MTKEAIQTYSLRVAQANQSELTVITFEIFIDYVNDAIDNINEGNTDEYVFCLGKARAFLSEIMAALNYENEVSFRLIRIYEYVYRTLVALKPEPDIELLKRIKGIMKTLLAGYREVAAKDNSKGISEKSQQVYAGLTYGRGYLNETCQGEGESWKA